jgi:hypothetical protein
LTTWKSPYNQSSTGENQMTAENLNDDDMMSLFDSFQKVTGYILFWELSKGEILVDCWTADETDSPEDRIGDDRLWTYSGTRRECMKHVLKQFNKALIEN